MRMIGGSAIAASAVSSELQQAGRAGLAAFVWCDGQEVTGVFADEDDSPHDVLAFVNKVLPEGWQA